MSSIAASNQERTNRWLLIGAAVLALIAGIIVAVALSNAGGGSDSTKKAAGGDAKVLVANQTIPANKKITAAMFELQTVSTAALVVSPVSDVKVVEGQVARSDILKGEQLSYNRLGLGDTIDPSLAPKIPDGKVGFPVSVDEAGSVAGLLVPGDRVDMIVVSKEKRGDQDVTRVETVLQNVEVLAFAQDAIASRPLLDAQGNPVPSGTSTSGDTRQEANKPNPGARTVTLALTPGQVQAVAAVQDRGRVLFSLRKLGDDSDHSIDRTFLGEFGFIPPTPIPARP